MENRTADKSAFNKFHHVGMVVRDMDKTIASLTSLGIGPFGMPGGQSMVEVPFHGELHGKPAEWKVKISMGKMGELDVELLQPSGGESALQEFLDNNGEGIHHICFIVENVDNETAKLVKQGAEVLTTGEGTKGGFVYIETGGGAVIELRTP